MRTAAAIIREDIRSMAYQTYEYEPPHSTFDNAMSVVPDRLKVLLDDLINKQKINTEVDKKRECVVIIHAIISSTRPRSFLSMVHGLSSYIHRHVGSRHLVDISFNMGLCASYGEARRYKSSAMLDDQETIHPDSFKQFVLDTSDFNILTLDGYGTFHSMGGIMCITPTDAVEKAAVTKRIEKVPSAESL